jgi:cellulose synthase/poly-beta-1,6-N-acetylglucosamine synthase-like glycosyltransferase
VSGAYVAKAAPGLLALTQRVEYAQERRKITRRTGRVNVLSGAAAMFSAGLLRQVAAHRGSLLPGTPGEFYDTTSLTEDFEITLACQVLGCAPVSPSRLRVVTDIMDTVPELYGQRLRWQRGYLETLVKYPLRMTWAAWARQVGVYAASVLPFLVLALSIASWHTFGLHIQWKWMLIQPVFIAAEVVGARSVGWRGMLLAGLLVPLIAYNIWRGYVYWRALGASLIRRTAAWT